MIDHEWLAEVTGDLREELRRLLTEAAEADAEAGFPSFALDDAVPAGTRYLLIWLLPDDRTGHSEDTRTLAGCLRLEPESGADPADAPAADARAAEARAAEARLVIRPELRSRGITVLLTERLGLGVDRPDGWAGTGVRHVYCWARGNHPAAQRLTLRFGSRDETDGTTGLRRTRREWRLVVPLHARADLETLRGVRDVPADVADELRARADEPGYDAESVLDKALLGLREDGAEIGSLIVDDRRRALLVACRTLGFQHDRTDARYDLG